MHRPHMLRAWPLAVQQVQEMTADAVVIGLHFDAAAVLSEVVPIEQHRAERGHQPVGDVARAGMVMVVCFGQDAAESRDARAHHVHRMGRGRDGFQSGPHRSRQAAQGAELDLVG